MKKRILGRTGIAVSEIGVGAWQLGGPLVLDGKTDGHPDLGVEYVIGLIRACGEMGINFIDTAEQYGNGESERRVGEALKGQRDRWVISTKFGNQVGPGGERIKDASARRLPVSLEGSLRRLGTDYIDVYLYHVPPEEKEAEGVARFLEQAKRKGQIRASGISSANIADMKLLLSLGCLDVVQFPCSIMASQEEIRAFCAQHNVGGVVRGAFHGGRLSGKYFRRRPAFGRDDIRSTRFDEKTVGEEFARYAVFEKLVRPGRTMAQVALRYVLDEATTHTVILGAKSVEDYRVAVGATEMAGLEDGERKMIGELRAAL